MFKVLENLTVFNVTFLSFFINRHDTIINGHKIQFIKNLNHLDKENFINFKVMTEVI